MLISSSFRPRTSECIVRQVILQDLASTPDGRLPANQRPKLGDRGAVS